MALFYPGQSIIKMWKVLAYEEAVGSKAGHIDPAAISSLQPNQVQLVDQAQVRRTMTYDACFFAVMNPSLCIEIYQGHIIKVEHGNEWPSCPLHNLYQKHERMSTCILTLVEIYIL